MKEAPTTLGQCCARSTGGRWQSAHRERQAGPGDSDRTAEPGTGGVRGATPIRSRKQVREHERSNPCRGGLLPGVTGTGQRRLPVRHLVDEAGFGQEHVRAAGQFDKRRVGSRIAGVNERAVARP